MSKFTPGVWREHHSSAPDWEGVWYINSGSQMIVMGEGWSEQQQANAKLIAKAPEMYDMLKNIIAEPSQLVDDELIRKLLEEI